MFSKALKKLFKKKVFKLGMVATSLFGLMISSGFSFAKYIDTNYGDGSAGTAKFDGGTITFIKTVYHQSTITTDDLGIYAHYLEFKLEFNTEVASKYSLSIRFGEYNSGTWDNPGDTDYSFVFNETDTQPQPYTVTINNTDGTCTLVKDNVGELFFGTGKTFESNIFYVYEGKTGSDYTLSSDSNISLSSDGILNLATDKYIDLSNSSSLIYYYKIIFFIDIQEEDISNNTSEDNTNYEGSIEKCSILYNINVEQVI